MSSVESCPPASPYGPYVTYPNDTPAYVDYKKSLYGMNQGLGNLCYSAQAVSDYYNFYQTNPALYQAELAEKYAKFQRNLDYMNEMTQNHQLALLNLQASMAGFGISPLAMSGLPTLSDDIPINHELL